MTERRWLYAVVDFIRGKAQVTVLMPNGDHRVTAVGSEEEAFTVIAQMGSEGWEMTGAEQQVRTRVLTEATYTDFRRLWFKKPIEG
ncbi:MAG: hypothetical protein IPM16_07345 [Chloroflexi bacterium]|nr:hypothetical protein [Chloroflexota bacterium]